LALCEHKCGSVFSAYKFPSPGLPHRAKIATKVTAISVLLYACMPGSLRKHAAYYDAQYQNLISSLKKSARAQTEKTSFYC